MLGSLKVVKRTTVFAMILKTRHFPIPKFHQLTLSSLKQQDKDQGRMVSSHVHIKQTKAARTLKISLNVISKPAVHWSLDFGGLVCS